MAVLPATRPSSEWPDVIESLMVTTRRATIMVYDDRVFTEDKPYDIHTNTGGIRTYTPLWSGLARIIEMRLSEAQTATDEWGTKRGYHFDIALEPGLPFFHKGLRIRVLDGHRDPSLESMSFSILSAANSSEANQRDILASTEGAKVG